MATSVKVVNRDYYFQLSNGDTFGTDLTNKSDHFSGAVQESVKAVLDVEIYTLLQLTDWTYKLDGSGGSMILQESIDFADEDFHEGGIMMLTIGASTTIYNLAITYAGKGELRLDGLLGALIEGVNAGDSAEGDWLRLSTRPDALKYSFGLVGQNESASYESKLTDINNTFLFEGLTGIFQEGISQGEIKGGVSGICRAKYVGQLNDYIPPVGVKVYTTVFQYQIELEFLILPFHQDGELSNISNLIAPSLFLGDATLKHISKFDFREDLNDPNTSRIGEDEGNLGSIAWFNESFNGLPSDYSITDVSYEDNAANSMQAIEIGGATEATDYTLVRFSINSASASLAVSMPIVVNISMLPELDEYNVSKDDFQNTWVFDNVRTVGVETSGVILKPSYTFVSASKIDVAVKVFYPESARERIYEDENYLLSVLVANNALDVNESGKVQLIIAQGQIFIDTDIAGLFSVPKLNVFTHGQTLDDTPTQDAILWNEDGIMIGYDILLTDPVNTSLESLEVNLIAEDSETGDSFIIQRNNIDLSTLEIIEGILHISHDKRRGFPLNIDDIFNIDRLIKPSVSNAADTIAFIVGTTTFDATVTNSGTATSWIDQNGATVQTDTPSFTGLVSGDTIQLVVLDLSTVSVVEVNGATQIIDITDISKVAPIDLEVSVRGHNIPSARIDALIVEVAGAVLPVSAFIFDLYNANAWDADFTGVQTPRVNAINTLYAASGAEIKVPFIKVSTNKAGSAALDFAANNNYVILENGTYTSSALNYATIGITGSRDVYFYYHNVTSLRAIYFDNESITEFSSAQPLSPYNVQMQFNTGLVSFSANPLSLFTGIFQAHSNTLMASCAPSCGFSTSSLNISNNPALLSFTPDISSVFTGLFYAANNTLMASCAPSCEFITSGLNISLNIVLAAFTPKTISVFSGSFQSTGNTLMASCAPSCGFSTSSTQLHNNPALLSFTPDISSVFTGLFYAANNTLMASCAPSCEFITSDLQIQSAPVLAAFTPKTTSVFSGKFWMYSNSLLTSCAPSCTFLTTNLQIHYNLILTTFTPSTASIFKGYFSAIFSAINNNIFAGLINDQFESDFVDILLANNGMSSTTVDGILVDLANKTVNRHLLWTDIDDLIDIAGTNAAPTGSSAAARLDLVDPLKSHFELLTTT